MWLIRVEKVEVARTEYESVEHLCDQGDALGGSITMDGEDQDELREEVGDVSHIAEDLSGRLLSLDRLG